MFGDAVKRKEAFEASVIELQKEWGEKSDKLHKKKMVALQELKDKPRIADQPWGVGMEDWKYVILNKKVKQLRAVQTVEEVEEVLLLPNHSRPRVELPTHSKYWLLEEECLFWSLESSKSPLSSEGHTRFMKCFVQLCKERGMENPLEENRYVQMSLSN